jgi:hypothetical protein
MVQAAAAEFVKECGFDRLMAYEIGIFARRHHAIGDPFITTSPTQNAD